MKPSPVNNTVSTADVPDISLVIPLYNESASIVPLLDEIVQVLTGKVSFEIIAVNDGSSDATAGVLLKLMHSGQYPLRVIQHAENYGQSTALHTGIQSARACWVVTLDGDGQNDPGDILKLIQTRDQSTLPGLKLITGYRKKRQDNIIKIISSRVANAVRSSLLRDMTPDTGCGLKLIHRDAFLALPFFDHMHRFLPALMRRAGANIMSVEVSHRPRQAGTSKYTLHNRLWVGIVDLFGVLWLIRRAKNPVTKEVTRYVD